MLLLLGGTCCSDAEGRRGRRELSYLYDGLSFYILQTRRDFPPCNRHEVEVYVKHPVGCGWWWFTDGMYMYSSTLRYLYFTEIFSFSPMFCFHSTKTSFIFPTFILEPTLQVTFRRWHIFIFIYFKTKQQKNRKSLSLSKSLLFTINLIPSFIWKPLLWRALNYCLQCNELIKQTQTLES